MIYLASSWRNPFIDEVSTALAEANIRHYDFRSDGGFHWSEVDPDYKDKNLTFTDYIRMASSPEANTGFDRDWIHMLESRACILILPSGRSAHLEAGWFIGKGLPVGVLFKEEPVIPDLMYKMADFCTDHIPSIVNWTKRL